MSKLVNLGREMGAEERSAFNEWLSDCRLLMRRTRGSKVSIHVPDHRYVPFLLDLADRENVHIHMVGVVG